MIKIHEVLLDYMQDHPLPMVSNPMDELDERERLDYLGEFVLWCVTQGLHHEVTSQRQWDRVYFELGLGGRVGEAASAVFDVLSKTPGPPPRQ